MTKVEQIIQEQRSVEEQETENKPEEPREEETEDEPNTYRSIKLMRKLGIAILVWIRVIAGLSSL